MSPKVRKTAKRVLLFLVVVLVAIQLVPYGRAHDNPPVRREPAWASARTEELARAACYDCHSNQVAWPWYSHVAPASWLVESDVEEAREHLNFSEWDRPQRHADDAAEEVAEGEMPLWYYVLLHPRARLSDGERRELADGLKATLAADPAAPGGGSHEEDEDHEHDDED